jgi:hypothetical protein
MSPVRGWDHLTRVGLSGPFPRADLEDPDVFVKFRNKDLVRVLGINVLKQLDRPDVAVRVSHRVLRPGGTGTHPCPRPPLPVLGDGRSQLSWIAVAWKTA